MEVYGLNTESIKKPRKKWKRRLRKIIVLLIVLLLIAAAVWYAYSALRQEYTVTYDGYTATVGSISNSLSFSGSLSLVDSAAYTAASSATVRNVYVSAGDDVQEGDRLVRLSNGETIEAEFDGTVNTLSVEEDDEVSAGDELVQVADFDHMMVSIRVDEYDISEVYVGQACTVTATATEQTFDSEIDSINYISSSGGSVAYYTAEAYVDVGEGIYPGMQVTVTIPLEVAEDVVILNMNALSFDETNSAYVLMYNDAGELERVDVEVGVSNGSYVEIVSGLSEGDEVYVEVEEDASSDGLSGLLSGMFGSTEMNAPGGMGGGGFPGGEMPDFSSGEMPDFSGGEMPSFGGGGGMGGAGQ